MKSPLNKTQQGKMRRPWRIVCTFASNAQAKKARHAL